MVKDHSDFEGNPLPPVQVLLFPINSKVFLYASSHIQDSRYHAFVTPVVEHWLEREISQWIHHQWPWRIDPTIRNSSQDLDF